jgi:hypothetical protein
MEDSMSNRLPDFMFERDSIAEQEGGFLLAGVLLTDIPKGKIEEADQRFIAFIIERLGQAFRAGSSIMSAGIWRTGEIPADAANAPYPSDLISDRCEKCVSIIVRVQPVSGLEDGIRIDEETARKLGCIPVH